MIILRELIESDELSFRAAVAACFSDNPPTNFAFEFDGVTDFGAYINRLRQWTRGKGLPPKFVPNTFLVAVMDDEVVGRVSIRHVLNEFLMQFGGHVGYAVVPAHRRKGYAKEIMRLAIPVAARLGIKRVLLTCDDDNIGSIRVIESSGGVLENVVSQPGSEIPKRRYWIDPPQ